MQLVASPQDLSFGPSVGRTPDSVQEPPLGPLRLGTGLFLHKSQFSQLRPTRYCQKVAAGYSFPLEYFFKRCVRTLLKGLALALNHSYPGLQFGRDDGILVPVSLDCA
jgi:hypothetical protein